MSESWRRKSYYDPRVLIRTAFVLDPPFPDALVCLTGPQLAMLRNVTQYLHRRSTFASEYHEGYYLAPTNEEWDQLAAIVSDLEDKLMTCEDFMQLLQDIKALAECACDGASAGYLEPYLVNYYDDLEDAGTIVYELPDGTPTVVADDRCAVAQLVWAYQYELLVETLQPLQEFLHTVLLAAVLGLIGTAIGGPVLGMSAAALAGYITAFLNMGVESDLEAVENELFSLKKDLVCAMYQVFVEEGTYADAAQAAADVINGSSEWSPIDKLLFRRGFSPQFMAKAQEAWDEQTAWALGNVSADYCDACPEPPIQGSDWFAIPVYGESWYWYVPKGSSGVNMCFPDIDYPERYIQGVVYDVDGGASGYNAHRRRTRTDAGCSYVSGNMFQTTAPWWTLGRFIIINYTGITEAEVQAYFGGTMSDSGVNRVFAHGEGALQMQDNPNYWGSITVKYIIFAGTIE